MKKIILFIILNINFIFGYYNSGNLIDLLVHSNQVRIRLDSLGVLAGTSNLRFAAGLTGADSARDYIYDNISSDSTQTNAIGRLIPAALVAFGYDAGYWGIGAGYEFKFKNDAYMVHTPIITATALNDNFRISVPLSIGVGYRSFHVPTDITGTRVVSTGLEARYYFPKEMPILSHIRFYMNYGNAYIPNVQNEEEYLEQSSIGLQARVYFKIQREDVLIEPIFRIQYDQALPTKNNLGKNYTSSSKIFDNYEITAKGFNVYYPSVGPGATGGANGNPSLGSGIQGGYVASIPAGMYAIEPYRVNIAAPVGFSATSTNKMISFYLEPALSLTIIGAKNIYTSVDTTEERTIPFVSIGYVVYGEIYIRPVKSLEWYIEVQAGGTSRLADDMKNADATELVFNGSTGFHYYF